MLWYEMNGKDSDVVVSSRIRLARNLPEYPFPGRLDEAGSKEIIEKVGEIFSDDDAYQVIDFPSLGELERLSYAEKHLVSREFAAQKSPCALISSERDFLYIMLLEEDHIRIQSIMPGAALKEAYKAASAADMRIDQKLSVAYDEKLGYLTHCPTNLGTGMRASVMMFLPALTWSGGIRSLQNQLGKIGLTIRGASGEGSSADGCLYQISNQVTLGMSEEEIISNLESVCGKIADEERALREKMKQNGGVKFSDRIMRAYGTMLYAQLTDSKEFSELYANVRLGAALGMIDSLRVQRLDNMLICAMPATLMLSDGKIKTPADRDRARADMMRRVLSEPHSREAGN